MVHCGNLEAKKPRTEIPLKYNPQTTSVVDIYIRSKFTTKFYCRDFESKKRNPTSIQFTNSGLSIVLPLSSVVCLREDMQAWYHVHHHHRHHDYCLYCHCLHHHHHHDKDNHHHHHHHRRIVIISSYHHIIVWSYNHISISSYHRIIMSSYHHTSVGASPHSVQAEEASPLVATPPLSRSSVSNQLWNIWS